MTGMRSRRLVVPLALVLLTAGCLSEGPRADTSTEMTSTETLDEPMPRTPTTATTTPRVPTPTLTATPLGGDFDWDNRSEPERLVQLSNRWGQWVAVHVTVIQTATNETVHDDTYEVAPNGKPWTVYDLSENDPEGDDSFTVVVTSRGSTDRTTLTPTECHGRVHVHVTEDGAVRVFSDDC